MNFEETIQLGKNKLESIGVVESTISNANGDLYPQLPGLGWSGRGLSYSRNAEALARYSLQTRVLGNHFSPNTSISLFKEALSTPILAAPMSGIRSNLQDQIGEKDFLDMILAGCVDAGSLGACGDSYDMSNKHFESISVIKKNKGIAVLKPRKLEDLKERIQILNEINNTAAIGIDLDGITGLLLEAGKVSRKNKKDLQEIRSLSTCPMFLKGILSVEDVAIAHESGFDAVVISNHGGRSVDYCPAPAHVLPEISKHFKGKIKIFADGGIKNGYDAFIYLALGADAVLVGRTILYGVVGGGRRGVETVISKLTSDLSRAMLLTGCENLEEIGDPSIKLYE